MVHIKQTRNLLCNLSLLPVEELKKKRFLLVMHYTDVSVRMSDLLCNLLPLVLFINSSTAEKSRTFPACDVQYRRPNILLSVLLCNLSQLLQCCS